MLIGTRTMIAAVLMGAGLNAAAADICKYIDDDGRTVYSTVPIKNGKKVVCFKSAAPPPAPLTDEQIEARTERAVESAPKPRVDGSTQARRDNDRRGILQDELAREQKLLEEAQKRLAEEEAIRYGDERNYQRVLDRLKPYQDTVTQHQRNIDSLRKEIANLR